jgi:polyphosphate kinase 2 (PPK2 family)
MLETLDLDAALSKAAYEKAFRPLRDRLERLQRAAFEQGLPVAVVFEGLAAAGKGDTIEKLVGRIDPRGYEVHVTAPPTEEERLRPWQWRHWRRLPGRGEIAIFDHAWYRRVLVERVEGEVPRAEWSTAYDEINQLEKMLADGGTLVVKFYLHLAKAEQRRRFETMARSRYQAWRVTRSDWREHKRWRQYTEAAEEMLERTHTPWAPWTPVAATDKRWRRVRVFERLAEAMEQALAARAAAQAARPAPKPKARPARAPAQAPNVLDEADLGKKLTPARFEKEQERLQTRLRELEFACYGRRVPVVAAFEGWDAAGKGGAIKRLIGALDPRGYRVVPIAAPKGDDATHHYLWRFWARLPKAGHIAIFDRTWYGRVLVERIEGFCSETDWKRAYHEINEFERALHRAGTVVVKFWLHVSKAEQLRRFKERQRDPAKRYKITDEDWRNREQWDVYREAVHDMITQTSTSHAPWTIVEADDKLWARYRVMRTVADAIEQRLKAR